MALEIKIYPECLMFCFQFVFQLNYEYFCVCEKQKLLNSSTLGNTWLRYVYVWDLHWWKKILRLYLA